MLLVPVARLAQNNLRKVKTHTQQVPYSCLLPMYRSALVRQFSLYRSLARQAAAQNYRPASHWPLRSAAGSSILDTRLLATTPIYPAAHTMANSEEFVVLFDGVCNL